MKNNIENQSNLDRIFDVARNEKVTFSRETAANILTKYASTAKIGFWRSLLNKLSFKFRMVSAVVLTIVTTVTLFNSTELNNNKNEITKIENSERINIKTEILKNIDNGFVNKLTQINKRVKISAGNDDLFEIEGTIDKDFGETKKDYKKIENSDLIENDFSKDLNIQENDYQFNIQKTEYNDIFWDKENENLKTIAFDFSKHNGFSASFLSNLTSFGGSFTNLSGGKLLWTINEEISIGIIGYGGIVSKSSKFTDNKNFVSEGNLGVGYGGIFAEYTFYPDNFVHFSLNSTIGGGGFNFKQTSNPQKPWGAFMIFEPGAAIEMNLTKFLKAGFNLTYKLSHNFQENKAFENDLNYQNLKINGLSAGIFIKVGIF